MNQPIYFDHHATTPLDPRVLEAMLPVLKENYGNQASSGHRLGQMAAAHVDQARKHVAHLIGASPDEIIFTSGATESNNLALKGICEVYQEKGKHLITQVTEHKSVLEVFTHLEKKGFEVTYLPVDKKGKIAVDELKAALRKDTILISIMAANNEIGTIQPTEQIGKLAKDKNIFFHVDASQAVGKLDMDVEKLGVDLMSFSAHKIYGPKGVGALYVREKNPHVRLAPLFHGGGQERGLRSGTLNVPGIVGLGKACEILQGEMHEENKQLAELRNSLYDQILSEIDDVYLNGSFEERLSNNLNVSFPLVEGEKLLKMLNQNVAVSTGSACVSLDSDEPSYVLKAIGTPELLIHSSLRFGLGRFNTQEEVDFVANEVVQCVRELREVSPF